MCGKYIKFKLATLFVYIYIRSLPKTDKNADYCHIKKVYIGVSPFGIPIAEYHDVWIIHE